MDATSASVSGLNYRRWLQVWNTSGVILMTIFPEIVLRIACLFQAFLGAFSKYLGEHVAESDA